MGALDEQAALLIDVANQVRRVGITVDAADERGDVDVDDVTVGKWATVRDRDK